MCPSWPMIPTAPAKSGWPLASTCSWAWIRSTASAIGAGSSPSDTGLVSDRTVLGGANPRSGLLKSSAVARPAGPAVTRLPARARLPRAAGTRVRRRMSLLDSRGCRATKSGGGAAVDEVLPAAGVEGRELVPPGTDDLVGGGACGDLGAQPLRAGQLVDPVGPSRVVGVVAPGEVAVERLGGDEHLDRGPDRVERRRVGHVELDSAAHLAGVLAEGRGEVGLAEADAREVERCKTFGPLVVDEGGADELERSCRAASLGEVGA